MTINEGRLFLRPRAKYWVLDAEPHVMEMFSRLFPAASLSHDSDAMIYTHRPRTLADGLDARRDLDWFIQRFVIEISSRDIIQIKTGSKEYDRLQHEAEASFFNYEPPSLALAQPLREYQSQACSLFLSKKSLLLADQVGLGKTPTAIGAASLHLPALAIVPPHLVKQWELEILKFLPTARVHLIYGKKHYPLPEADFYVTAYSRISAWADFFGPSQIPIKTLILDEVHDLRNDSTQKFQAVESIAKHVERKLGLSATPVMNYGSDVYNIFRILEPGRLGSGDTFSREWCNWGKIRDPKLFGNFLRKNLMMVRRTREDVALQLEPVNRIVYTVDADLQSLQSLEKEAKALAMQVLSGDFRTSGLAARELDYKLRHATGVAKARAVAEMVKMLVESGEKVVLFGWHKDVYECWKKELSSCSPVFYTGDESTKEKQKSLDSFIKGDAKVFVMSLRSGAGINGLQEVSSYVIFGELDWSPGVTDQCIGRLWRDGQSHQVTAMFITINDGADPVMIKTIGLKSSEARQIVNPNAKSIGTVYSDEQRVKDLARGYLLSKGVEPPKREDPRADISLKETSADPDSDVECDISSSPFVDAPVQGSLEARVLDLLRGVPLSTHDERTLQDEIADTLKLGGVVFTKEKKIDKTSRLDFLIGDDVVLECKVDGANKRSMLRQLRKYKEKAPSIRAFVIVSPWSLKHFDLDGTPVYCVDASVSALLMGGLS